jgi:uncharacterized protein YjdB
MKTHIVFLVLGTLVAASCGKSSSSCADIVGPGCDLPTNEVEAVLITPSSDSLKVGATVQLTVTVYTKPANLVYTLAWSSSNSAAAGVDSSGLVTGRAASSGVAICATTSGTAEASVENCATVVVTP